MQASRVQIVDLSPMDTGTKEQELIANSSEQAFENRLDEQSVATHKLQESTGQVNMHNNNGLADLYKRNELNAQLHVGASYTFYNEQSTSKLDERDDVMRAKASS